MSDQTHLHAEHDIAPGDEEQHGVRERIIGYVVGLGLALLLSTFGMSRMKAWIL